MVDMLDLLEIVDMLDKMYMLDILNLFDILEMLDILDMSDFLDAFIIVDMIMNITNISKKLYNVERMRRHLYSFNSCILYTWVLLETLNNLYEFPLHTPNSQSLWFDL